MDDESMFPRQLAIGDGRQGCCDVLDDNVNTKTTATSTAAPTIIKQERHLYGENELGSSGIMQKTNLNSAAVSVIQQRLPGDIESTSPSSLGYTVKTQPTLLPLRPHYMVYTTPVLLRLFRDEYDIALVDSYIDEERIHTEGQQVGEENSQI